MKRRTFLAAGAMAAAMPGCSHLRDTADPAPVEWRYRVGSRGADPTCGTCSGVHHPPTVVDGTVHVGGPELVALDASDGIERWTYDTGRPALSRPLVRDGVAFALSGYGYSVDAGVAVHAVDAATGAGLWRNGDTDAGTLVGVAGDGVYVAQHNDSASPVGGQTVALAAGDGSERWRRETGDVYDPGAVTAGTVYVVGPASLFALDAGTGDVRWRRDGVAGSSVTLHDGTLYALLERGLVALDATTGRERWRLGVPSTAAVTWLVSPEIALAALDDGPLVALDARTGDARWRASPGAQVATLAVDGGARRSAGTDADEGSGGTVYLGTERSQRGPDLYAFDAADGTERWRYRSEDHSGVRSVAAGAAVYALFRDPDALVALDPADGTERWRLEPRGNLVTPVVGSGRVFLGTGDGELLAVSDR